MPVLTIPDEFLEATGLTERELLVELACFLFDSGKLSLWSASRLAGLDRAGMEAALLDRSIPVHRLDAGYLAQELKALDYLDSLEP
jgi:predicted HTH domain antitoxin